MDYDKDNKNINLNINLADYKFNSNEYIDNFEKTKNIGFNNIGHTCYMNSFLQILLHIPTFLPTLKDLYKKTIEKDTVVYNLIELSEHPRNKNLLYTIKQIIAKTYPKYGPYVQNDTQNFGIDLIDLIISEIKNENSFTSDSSEQNIINESISEENSILKIKTFKDFMVSYKKRGENTFIEDLILLIDSKIKYNNNLIDKKKIRYDIQLHIELIFPINNIKEKYSLYELLDYKYTNENKNLNKEIIKQEKKNNGIIDWIFNFLFYSVIEPFKNCIKGNEPEEDLQDNKSPIINTNSSNENKEISKIVILPKILIISLDRGIEGIELISSFVSFDEQLDLKNYVEEDLYDINLGTRYKLFAINIREGSTKSSGHCYCYVKVGNDWICFNDSDSKIEQPIYCLNSVVGLYYIKENFE